jgi:hypothetical protein
MIRGSWASTLPPGNVQVTRHGHEADQGPGGVEGVNRVLQGFPHWITAGLAAA